MYREWTGKTRSSCFRKPYLGFHNCLSKNGIQDSCRILPNLPPRKFKFHINSVHDLVGLYWTNPQYPESCSSIVVFFHGMQSRRRLGSGSLHKYIIRRFLRLCDHYVVSCQISKCQLTNSYHETTSCSWHILWRVYRIVFSKWYRYPPPYSASNDTRNSMSMELLISESSLNAFRAKRHRQAQMVCVHFGQKKYDM